jgi:peptidoglycan/xylan/chitin deacetylase (PgdA/CDA1 family)
MKKKIFAYFLYFSGLVFIKLLWIKLFGSNYLRILCYHRICDKKAANVFDKGVVTVSPSEFDAQINFLRKYFRFTRFDELAQTKVKECKAAGNLIITFDDGYEDSYSGAYQIMNKHGIPATIFLATGFVGTCNLFWWDQICAYINSTAEMGFQLNHKGSLIEFDISTPQLKEEVSSALITLAKKCPNEERQMLIDQLQSKLNRLEDELTYARALLSWVEIDEMKRQGIEFGGHTRDHVILRDISPVTLDYEVNTCFQDIQTNIGESPAAFAYPNGDYDMQVSKAVANAGFKFGCTLDKGVNSTKANRYMLRRIHADITGIMFKATLAFPTIMSFSLSTPKQSHG